MTQYDRPGRGRKDTMKIGILTHHYIANYGAFLQTYALQKTVERLRPADEAYVVDRVNMRHAAINMLGWFRRGGWRMPYLFARARRRFLRLSPRVSRDGKCNEKMDKMGFDVLIVGSDEVWNLADWKSFDPVKYGIGLSGTFVAYAPSAGRTRPDALTDAVKAGIRRFLYLSARDDAAERLAKAAGRSAVRVLDPVFLTPPVSWDDKGEKPFVLAYAAEDWLPEARRSIACWANAAGMDPWEDPTGLPPFVWAGRFGAAGCVVTGSLHGAVFAILAHKPFLCYTKNPDRRAKITSLLAELGLEARWLMPEGDAAKQMERPVDWARVDAILREKRALSLDYLKRSLEEAQERSAFSARAR